MVDQPVDYAAAFSECDAAGDDRPVRQGDLFEWIAPSVDAFEFLGVVITADCDFALKKHQGRVSYVPVLRFEDYLRIFFLPPRLRKAMKPIEDELCKIIRDAQAANLPEFPEAISTETALEWVNNATPTEIADELRLDGKKRPRLLSLVDSYKNTLAAVESADFALQHDCLVGLKSTKPTSFEEAKDKLWKDIAAAVKDLPGDLFFLGRVPSRDEAGFVVYLRLIRDLPESSVAVRQTDLRLTSVTAKRIARLRSPYRFRLTQQLASVFGDIGLPNEYEVHRQKVVETVAERAKQSAVVFGKREA